MLPIHVLYLRRSVEARMGFRHMYGYERTHGIMSVIPILHRQVNINQCSTGRTLSNTNPLWRVHRACLQAGESYSPFALLLVTCSCHFFRNWEISSCRGRLSSVILSFKASGGSMYHTECACSTEECKIGRGWASVLKTKSLRGRTYTWGWCQ